MACPDRLQRAAGDHSADRLLSHLDGVRQTGPGRWIACCPGHDDRHPSLNIREKEDGTLLVHCFGNECIPADIMAAVGLTLADLFPDVLPDRGPLRKGERWIHSDVWQCVAFEAEIAAAAAADVAAGGVITPEDAARVAIAADRLTSAAAIMGRL